MSVLESRKRIADKIYEHFHGESVKDFAQRENAAIQQKIELIQREKDRVQRENDRIQSKNKELLRKSVAQFLNLGISPRMIAQALTPFVR